MRSYAKAVKRVWYCEGWIYWLLGERACFVLERILYDFWLWADFGGDGYAGTVTLGTDSVPETTPGDSSGRGTITGDLELVPIEM